MGTLSTDRRFIIERESEIDRSLSRFVGTVSVVVDAVAEELEDATFNAGVVPSSFANAREGEAGTMTVGEEEEDEQKTGLMVGVEVGDASGTAIDVRTDPIPK